MENYSKLVSRITEIINTDYPCEDPWWRRQNPKIGVALKNYFTKELKKINPNMVVDNVSTKYGFSCFVSCPGVDAPHTHVYVSVDTDGFRDKHGKEEVERALESTRWGSTLTGLYRWARNTKDYTGLSNNFATVKELPKAVAKMFTND